MSYGPSTNLGFLAAIRSSVTLLATCAGGLALAQTLNPRELPTLAPMIETTAPAVVNIAVTTNVDTGAPNPQDELLRRFFRARR